MKKTTSIFIASMMTIMVAGVARAEIADIRFVADYVEEQVETKADKSAVYTKEEMDTALAGKQPVGDYATVIALNAVKAKAYTAVQPNDLAAVATSGSYNDLADKPTIPEAQVQSDWNATTGVAAIANKPTLATVATSGSYNDLADKPTIPAGYTLPAATADALGGVKSGGDISVATTGVVTVTHATSADTATSATTATNATNATNAANATNATTATNAKKICHTSSCTDYVDIWVE